MTDREGEGANPRVGKLWSTSREGVEADSTRSSLVNTFITMTCQGVQALLIDVAAARREPERLAYLGLIWTRCVRRPLLLGTLLRSDCARREGVRRDGVYGDGARREPRNGKVMQGEAVNGRDSAAFRCAAALGALGGVWAPALWLKGARPTRAGLAVGIAGGVLSIAGDRSWKGFLKGINAGATAALGNDPQLAAEGGARWGISHGANLGLAATVIRGGVAGTSTREQHVSVGQMSVRHAGARHTRARHKTAGRAQSLHTQAKTLKTLDILTRLITGVGEMLVNDGLTRRR